MADTPTPDLDQLRAETTELRARLAVTEALLAEANHLRLQALVLAEVNSRRIAELEALPVPTDATPSDAVR